MIGTGVGLLLNHIQSASTLTENRPSPDDVGFVPCPHAALAATAATNATIVTARIASTPPDEGWKAQVVPNTSDIASIDNRSGDYLRRAKPVKPCGVVRSSC
ncbi:MAG: hypothetical protein U1F15_14120 [Burkholderiales bacterium]